MAACNKCASATTTDITPIPFGRWRAAEESALRSVTICRLDQTCLERCLLPSCGSGRELENQQDHRFLPLFTSEVGTSPTMTILGTWPGQLPDNLSDSKKALAQMQKKIPTQVGNADDPICAKLETITKAVDSGD
jgi:hypothetical protein